MSGAGDVVRVGTAVLSLDAVVAEIGHGGPAESDPEAGALVTFSGIVREMEGDRAIPRLDYEHYAGMAEQEMAALVAEARRRWPLRRVALVHRVGAVPVGQASVIVAVSAGHRVESFAAARFLIDELKKSVPIWKMTPPTE